MTMELARVGRQAQDTGYTATRAFQQHNGSNYGMNPSGMGPTRMAGYGQLAISKSEPGLKLRPNRNRFRSAANEILGGGSSKPEPSSFARDVSLGALAKYNPAADRIMQEQGALAARGYWGIKPPKANAYKPKVDPRLYGKYKMFTVDKNPPTEFRRMFERGDIPVNLISGARFAIEWRVEPQKLDYMHYLPIFMDGLREMAHPFNSMAELCISDMLDRGQGQILAVIPRLIIPLKTCLDTKHPEIVGRCLRVIKHLAISDDKVGEALVPYFRQLLPVCNMFSSRNTNTGGAMDYGQRFNKNLGDIIQDLLATLEKHGGEDAFINIKYMVPTYESMIL